MKKNEIWKEEYLEQFEKFRKDFNIKWNFWTFWKFENIWKICKNWLEKFGNFRKGI